MIRAGTLDQYITIQSQVLAWDDGIGNEVQQRSWATFAEVWAMIRPVSAYEIFNAGRTVEARSHVITIRFLDGITSEMRIDHNGRIYNIKGIRDIDFLHETLDLSVLEQD